MKFCALKNIADVRTSNVDKKTNIGEKSVKLCNYTDVYYNWAIYKDFEENFMNATAKEEEIDKFKLHKDDIAITKDSETKNDIGKSTYFYDELQNSILGYHCALIRPYKDKLNGGYLNAIFNSKFGQTYFELNAGGSGQRFYLNKDIIENIPIPLIAYDKQKQIGDLLNRIDKKIFINNKINKVLQKQMQTLYDYWFNQFDFPDENGKPYKSSGRKMVYNEKLKREIPEGWEVKNIIDNQLCSVIKPGVEKFIEKIYYATADIEGNSINTGTVVTYENRETRANMQPKIYSVWFAKMKKSIKHIFCNKEMKYLIDNAIFSTGFLGLKCDEISFEYIASFIANPLFEIMKDRLSHGATQEAVNNDDLTNINLIIPKYTILTKYHNTTKNIYSKMMSNIGENKQLNNIRDFLLPLLMNGQAKIE